MPPAGRTQQRPLLSVGAVLIAAWFSTDRAEGDVPLSARAVRRLQRLAWVRRSVGLLALGLMITGVLLGSAGVTVANPADR